MVQILKENSEWFKLNKAVHQKGQRMINKRYFHGLQALRGILFLLVFLSHSGAFIGFTAFAGAFGVSAFFVLSGFLSGYFFNPAQIQGKMIQVGVLYLWKKLKTFYPLYFAFLVLSIPLVHNAPQNNYDKFSGSLMFDSKLFGGGKNRTLF